MKQIYSKTNLDIMLYTNSKLVSGNTDLGITQISSFVCSSYEVKKNLDTTLKVCDLLATS